MGPGKVAPAALMVSAEAAVVAATAMSAIQSICLFMNRVPPFAGTAVAAPYCYDALEARHATRQRVSDVEVDGAVVGLVRRTCSVVPGIARQVFILADQIDGAVARAAPNGLVEAERDFLNGLVLAVR